MHHCSTQTNAPPHVCASAGPSFSTPVHACLTLSPPLHPHARDSDAVCPSLCAGKPMNGSVASPSGQGRDFFGDQADDPDFFDKLPDEASLCCTS